MECISFNIIVERYFTDQFIHMKQFYNNTSTEDRAKYTFGNRRSDRIVF